MTKTGSNDISRIELKGLAPSELEAVAVSLGLEPYRGRQIVSWIYHRGAISFSEMTDISRKVREHLTERASIMHLRMVSEVRTEGAVKYLFELPDGSCVESVLMEESARRTLCISSQVGCPLGCTFCATARMGLHRNLTAGEILDQLLSVRRVLAEGGQDLTNVVIMGMGEPLLNYDAVVRAVRLMNLDHGPDVGMRRITLSTAGHVPGIRRLAGEGLKMGLAISLNATTDEQRSAIMPVNRKWPIAALLAAASLYGRRTHRRVTFEYVLLKGYNDSLQDAQRLVALVQSIPCKINVIPWNPVEGSPYRRPSRGRIERFVETLAAACLTATVRHSKGTDVAAGCGQLYHESTPVGRL